MSADHRVLLVGERGDIQPLAAWAQADPAVVIEGVCVLQCDGVPDGDYAAMRVLWGEQGAAAWLGEQTEPGVVVSFQGSALARELAGAASAAGWRVAQVPRPTHVLGGVRASSARPMSERFDLASLIGRAPRAVNAGAFERAVGGRRVLVTGAGGSIGSEIARLVGAHASELVLVDRSENALFEIDRRLRERAPAAACRTVLHDVVDEIATSARVAI
ncbi:MAG: polysaccharide biosynthesis protein, partial [Planctomycetota bacterium]